MEKLLVLLHLDDNGASLPKAAFETIASALKLAAVEQITIGIIGNDIKPAADSAASTGARILVVSGPEFGQARYVTDAAAAEALCRAAEATVVLAPASSRFARALPGVAHRLNGAIDTHVTAIGRPFSVSRWFYRQRIEVTLQRSTRPWILLLESGINEAWQGSPADAQVEQLTATLPTIRTQVTGIRAPNLDEQTIRPDAKLLFVAGAGWTKKQPDGRSYTCEAELLIKDFLRDTGASLGSSKSLVDQSSENQSVLTFLTHLNQVGQTGSSPRHPKGLSTCCHGEEPHVVGWRFINERRAINLDANCGWARGKADVVYVADAFQVMAKLNALLEEKKCAGATV
jgi:electron transfer flavoprotein alpha subunit